MLASDGGAVPETPSGRLGHWRAPFRRPGYTAYAFASGAGSFSWALSAVAFAWVTLVVTTEPVAVGAVFAIRFVALLLFGIPAGVLADRVDRRRLLIAASLGSAVVGAVLAVVAAAEGGTLPFWALLGGSFLLGVLDAGRIATSTTYAFDLVGPALATSGIAVVNVLGQMAGIAGSIVGGQLLGTAGLPAALGVMSLGMLVSAAVLALSRGHRRRIDTRPKVAPAGLRVSMTLLRRNRLLALLTLTVVMVEILGFSSLTLIPVFAREVFGAGPDAYGAMSAIRSVGGVLGLLVVIRLGSRVTRGLALTGVDAVFGAGLIAFAFSPGLGAAVLPLLVVGAAAAASDSLSQSLVQRAAGDAERGAAMGLWAFALGVGPLGHIVAGAAAGQFGPVATQAVFGGVLVLVMIALSFQPLIRGLRQDDPAAGDERALPELGAPPSA
jgi:MFS family permease